MGGVDVKSSSLHLSAGVIGNDQGAAAGVAAGVTTGSGPTATASQVRQTRLQPVSDTQKREVREVHKQPLSNGGGNDGASIPASDGSVNSPNMILGMVKTGVAWTRVDGMSSKLENVAQPIDGGKVGFRLPPKSTPSLSYKRRRTWKAGPRLSQAYYPNTSQEECLHKRSPPKTSGSSGHGCSNRRVSVKWGRGEHWDNVAGTVPEQRRRRHVWQCRDIGRGGSNHTVAGSGKVGDCLSIGNECAGGFPSEEVYVMGPVTMLNADYFETELESSSGSDSESRWWCGDGDGRGKDFERTGRSSTRSRSEGGVWMAPGWRWVECAGQRGGAGLGKGGW
ncbi:unnamed protein product, partial [Choristocarpus tenellus]